MKNPKLPYILFFVAGVKPTPQELAQSSKIRGRVGMRNASVVQPGESMEPCDGVAGLVPDAYKTRPTAQAAIDAFDAKIEAASKLVGDKPAPAAPKPATLPAAAKTGASKPADDGKPTNLPGGDGKPPAWGTPVSKP